MEITVEVVASIGPSCLPVDHLRNHGALLDENSGQWDWSPVFDLEPRAIQPDEALSTALHWQGDYRVSVALALFHQCHASLLRA